MERPRKENCQVRENGIRQEHERKKKLLGRCFHWEQENWRETAEYNIVTKVMK